MHNIMKKNTKGKSINIDRLLYILLLFIIDGIIIFLSEVHSMNV